MEPIGSIPRVETITVDMWEPEMPDRRPPPRRSLPAAILAGALFFVILEYPTVDKWTQSQSQPVLKAKRALEQGLTVVHPFPIPVPTINNWEPEMEGPPRQAPRLIEVGLTVFSSLPIPAVVEAKLDSWYRALEEPLRSRRPTDGGEFAPVLVAGVAATDIIDLIGGLGIIPFPR